jgi:TatD DNase family protein
VIDSHTHLDSTPGEVAEIVARAREAGVTRMLTIGTDPDSNEAALEAADGPRRGLRRRRPPPQQRRQLRRLGGDTAAHVRPRPGCRAIGETGLDYYRDHSTPEEQEHAFAAQIELAREFELPLVIHTRAAEDDTIATLARDAQGLEVIMHCFSMPSRLEECLANGWWISFAGNVTYPKAYDLAWAAETVPLDRMLVETDAPYLTPQAVRKERNQPANVVHTARFVAERRGISYEELEAAVEANAAALFRW